MRDLSGNRLESIQLRERIRHLVHHLEHVLPAQAPIKEFVHHNTLHGYQHLHFTSALKASRELTGAAGYLSPERYRALYAEGRINAEDLTATLRDQLGDEVDQPLWPAASEPALNKGEVYLAVLRHPLEKLSRSQLKWQIEEMAALTRIQPDVEDAPRRRLLAGAEGEADAVANLWSACLETLGLEDALRHPEELLDPSSEQMAALASSLLREHGQDAAGAEADALAQHVLERGAAGLLDALLAKVGDEWTLRGLLKALTGIDILDEIRPVLIRHVSAHLDQGLSAWGNPAQAKGFYAAWRESADQDAFWMFHDMREWRQQLERLPDDPVDSLLQELRLLGLPEDKWEAYLQRLTLQLPGWSGMALWRSQHPGYAGSMNLIAMQDYLAVFLVMERLFAQRLCRLNWRIEASIPGLRGYFRHQSAELLVRHDLFLGRLPEFLVGFAEQRVRATLQDRGTHESEWLHVAQLIWRWRQTPAADRKAGSSVAGTAWPLFRLAQHLGLSGQAVRQVGAEGVKALLAARQRFDTDAFGYLWLNAYERHYREQIFAGLTANHGRGPWAERPQRPEAQLVFCMDDREEGTRRHLEEINPRLETLGAAAHFGVFQNWWGLDDTAPTVLCPVVARPAHDVHERPRPEDRIRFEGYTSRQQRRLYWRERLHQGSRAGVLGATLKTVAAAPLALLTLAGKAVAPWATSRLGNSLRTSFDGQIATRIDFVADNASPPSTPDNPRQGFTDAEQAERVGNFLRNIGLTDGFAPLVVIVGHGSNSLNNPHLAAYDCGACSGRHSGPNARLFASMANRPEVRALLTERNIVIPDTAWFIGCEHNTCDDEVEFYDVEEVPENLRAGLAKLRAELRQAGEAHAQERCRRLASAPLGLSQMDAWTHVHGRRWDYSQARPELGHATNAWALIGRRSVTRGAFWDRRAFLISYDPTRDPEGYVLEGLLLANGPVGAGINLEYYFSTVDNERYGCGTKTMHNVAGFFGVMEGASSDLRTGLPRQMIEIHEAMRLLVVVEHKIEVITQIYKRQPPLQELIGGGWLIVAAKDPDSPALHLFDPAKGWLPWQGSDAEVPTRNRSAEWFAGVRDPLPPALLNRPLGGER